MAEMKPTPEAAHATPSRDKRGNEFSQPRTMRSDLERLLALRHKEEPPKKIEKVPASAEKRNVFGELNWRNVLVAGFIMFFAAIIFAFVKFVKPLDLFKSTPHEENTEPPPPPVVITLPPPFFAVENSRAKTMAARDRSAFREFILDTANETQSAGRITRLAVKIQEAGQERFMSTADFFEYTLINPPSQFLSRIGNQPMLFIYYGTGGPRAGMTVGTKDFGRTFRDMLSWEPRLLDEFRLLLLGATSTSASAFEDRTYRNVDWRYLKFPGAEDRGIGYGIFPARNLLLLVTSRASFEAVIDRLLSQ